MFICRGTTFDYFSIEFDAPVVAGEDLKFRVKQVFTHILSPLPESIHQNDNQKMVFSSNVYYDTIYETLSQV